MGLIFLRFFKFICEKSCPRLDIGRRGLFPEIYKAVYKPNGGLSDARNAGLRQAHGDLVAFVDSDDWLALDMIEKMTDAMLRNQADMVICQYVVAYADGRFEKRAPENGPEEILNQQQALAN